MNETKVEKPRVVVAMSGGVDSSVTAALLASQGYQVAGMMMHLWSESGDNGSNRFCTKDSLARASNVAAILGIPFQIIDAQQIFRQTVVEDFIKGYTQGLTPNPCLVCNRIIRWDFLLERALASGADYMATGHYCRLLKDAQGSVQLLRGLDQAKDQSYVLHVLAQKQLKRTMLPLGEFTKPQVRQMAHDFQLPVADQADSQDLCFLGNEDYREFLGRYAPHTIQPGPIITHNDQIIGEHQGLALYTIGQRKGIRIASSHPLFVLHKDITRNALIVGSLEELGKQNLETGEINWISGQAPRSSFRANLKIRYNATFAPGTVTPLPDGSAHIHFDQPLRDITPGQSAVIYDGEVCLGGGVIQF